MVSRYRSAFREDRRGRYGLELRSIPWLTAPCPTEGWARSRARLAAIAAALVGLAAGMAALRSPEAAPPGRAAADAEIGVRTTAFAVG